MPRISNAPERCQSEAVTRISYPSPGAGRSSFGSIFGNPNPAIKLVMIPACVTTAVCKISFCIMSKIMVRSALNNRSCTSCKLSPFGGRLSAPPLSHSKNSGFLTSSSADFPSQNPFQSDFLQFVPKNPEIKSLPFPYIAATDCYKLFQHADIQIHLICYTVR